jgi:hypothetical protein
LALTAACQPALGLQWACDGKKGAIASLLAASAASVVAGEVIIPGSGEGCCDSAVTWIERVDMLLKLDIDLIHFAPNDV